MGEKLRTDWMEDSHTTSKQASRESNEGGQFRIGSEGFGLDLNQSCSCLPERLENSQAIETAFSKVASEALPTST